MKKLLAALSPLALYATFALADAPTEEPHVQMVWVWVFVALFFGSIVAVGWMMWRGEKSERQEKQAESVASTKGTAAHKS